MDVKILVADRYLGNDLKARDCPAGSTLQTRDWYGKKLIEGGLAEALTLPSPTGRGNTESPLAPLEKKGGKSKKASPKKGGAAPVANVFLE
jgi:hypothetical protein